MTMLDDNLIHTFYFAEGKIGKTSIAGMTAGADESSSHKAWNSLQAIGNIALAYSYSNVLIEIQVSQSLLPFNLFIFSKKKLFIFIFIFN